MSRFVPKLTEEQVRDARYLLKNGLPVKLVASYFGVNRTTMYAIQHKRIWKNV